MVFMGALNNFDQLFGWAYDKCVPLVREITFENAEVRLSVRWSSVWLIIKSFLRCYQRLNVY